MQLRKNIQIPIMLPTGRFARYTSIGLSGLIFSLMAPSASAAPFDNYKTFIKQKVPLITNGLGIGNITPVTNFLAEGLPFFVLVPLAVYIMYLAYKAKEAQNNRDNALVVEIIKDGFSAVLVVFLASLLVDLVLGSATGGTGTGGA
jgi:hypothetical protein